MSSRPFVSVFEQVFDVAVFGAGYAGYAAAQALSRAGKSVLLVDPYGDLLWESGRCFVPELGEESAREDSAMAELLADLRVRNGFDGKHLDGGMAEISATCLLKKSDIRTLYYAYPVAVERENGLLQSLIVATKSGPRRVIARQFVDASEKGLLLTLAGQTPRRRNASRREIYMHMLNNNWPTQTAGAPTLWPNQRMFVTPVQSNETTRQATERMIRNLSDGDKQAVLSHVSYEPYCMYDATPVTHALHGNLAVASPECVGDAVITLADRYALGLKAARHLIDMPRANHGEELFDAPIPAIAATREITTDVAVVGVGTGGAFAAITAGQQGAKVLAIDPFTFPGGIGTGGGIHAYYYGIPGGFQDVIDSETRQLMKAYGEVLSSHSFNPMARMIVLENHFAKNGVHFLFHAMLCNVIVKNGRVEKALIATESGPVCVVARVFVDGTGDGDLCSLAGAEFSVGRENDGIPHAYSQPTGGIHVREHNIRAGSRNLDSGWCDPSDSEDLTRARVTGITHYQMEKPTPDNRVTYVAPAIGLRQGRMIRSDYHVTLDDEVTGRNFEDVIGYAGSNYDAHTADYPLESDEGVFWICLARAWYTGMVIPLPYRSLLPVGLSNVIIASRCLGMTQDAHYGLRMMRCMQRIGEAAGYAAAFTVQNHLNNLRDVAIGEIQKKLKATGALLDDLSTVGQGWFKTICDEMAARPANLSLNKDPRALKALQNLKDGKADSAFWILMKNRAIFETQVLDVLRHSENSMSRWYAAGIAAMWGHPEAEPVLIEMVRNRDFGFARRGDWTGPREGHDPLVTARATQNWLTAVCLLRVCGSDRCLPVLDELIASHQPTLLTAESVLLTLSRLLESKRIENFSAAQKILAHVQQKSVSHTYIIPQATVTGLADIALRGWDGAVKAPCQNEPGWPYCNTAEDHRWQLTLMMAKVCRQLGIAMPAELNEQLNTDRLIVRRSLEKFQQPVSVG